MKKFVPGTVAGIVAATLLAAPALAAPGNVSVRIEGNDQTLVPPSTVTTAALPVGKDGKTCPGTTAFGAMHAATGGDWVGTYFDDFSSWFVETIKGETHASAAAGYWAVWVNNVHSDLGLCGAELQQGDALLIVPDNAGPVLELTGIPATVAPGQSLTAQVTEHGFVTNPDYSTTTTPRPADGATVTFGGGTATTGSDGKARLTFSGSGPVTIQATEAGHVRSAAAITCVTSGNDGSCGSQLPPGTALGTQKPADTTAPVATLSGLENGAKYSRKRAPRELKGTVSADPSGIKSVRLSILRKHKGRCWAFDGASERFRAHRCGGSRSFRIGDRAAWSYLLPKRLPAGRYTIRVAAIDKAGNASATETRIRVK